MKPHLALLFLATVCISPAAEITRFPATADIPDAVRLQRSDLLHTSLLAAPTFDEIADSLSEVASSHNAALTDIAKLNLYVADPDLIAAAEQGIRDTWPPGNRPAITLISSHLPGDNNKFAADAVIALDTSSGVVARFAGGATLPAGRDALYLSGRAASGELAEATALTMKELFAVLDHLDARPADVVQVKAFLQPMSDWKKVERAIEESLGDEPTPPIVYVEWNSQSRSTEIELIAAAPFAEDTNETISYFTPPGDKPSPVFSRVARLHANEIIYIGGLTAKTATTSEEETRSLFTELGGVATATGSSLLHFAKATYYVAEEGNDISAALGKLRPDYYDPSRPPAASKIGLPAIGIPNRHLLIDMVAAPVKKIQLIPE